MTLLFFHFLDGGQFYDLSGDVLVPKASHESACDHLVAKQDLPSPEPIVKLHSSAAAFSGAPYWPEFLSSS